MNTTKHLGTFFEELRSKFFWRAFLFFLFILLPVWILYLWFVQGRSVVAEETNIPISVQEKILTPAQ